MFISKSYFLMQVPLPQYGSAPPLVIARVNGEDQHGWFFSGLYFKSANAQCHIFLPQEFSSPRLSFWPLNKDQYLQPATNLVKDAHALGLEVYAYKFANDVISSYNYSYDPSAEYLQFIDNSDFSVDGVLTDFPSTASAAIGKDHCLKEAKLITGLASSHLIFHGARSKPKATLHTLQPEGIAIVDAVSSALINASYDKETRQTDVIHKMRAANLSGSPCKRLSKNLSYTILPAQPGSLLNLTEPGALPPAAGPAPVLEAADVVDPPLPPVTVGGHGAASPSNDSSTKSGATAASASAGLCLLVAGLAALLALTLTKEPCYSSYGFNDIIQATQVRFPYVLNGDMITGQYFLSLITDVLDWRRLAVLLKLLKESDH
ncbi:hypothetical protein HU200_042786 [Digitaria exilis]|uniref:glycerophosphodiester phosphodiesterase n=1 Tax=Digitaria exilis TaxID=1010633 RepID=A0A835BD55_9POAL|nr:hypothetical protein HU200_042786 [Digitaria exilis]